MSIKTQGDRRREPGSHRSAYMMSVLAERGHGVVIIKKIQAAKTADIRETLRSEIQPVVSALLTDNELDNMVERIRKLPDPKPSGLLTGKDLVSGLQIFLLAPMVGGAIGLTQGVAAGLELTLSLGQFELYSESEYLFDLDSIENNFFYTWSDLTYTPTDWLWVGISGQRTRLYETDLDIQRGIIVGGGLKWWEVTTYCYNLGFDDPFVLVTWSAFF